jgi:tRNA-splicing endonuclease subunit Sen2
MVDQPQIDLAVGDVTEPVKDNLNTKSSAAVEKPALDKPRQNGTLAADALVNGAPGAKKTNANSSKLRGPTRAQQLNLLYSLPVPLRTFPLPTFIPHNPVSLFQVLFTWLSQTIHPPSSLPETPLQGMFSSDLRSVHVTDERSMKALWTQGFFGKGSLSRSEPSWLNRQKRRVGVAASKTSEEVTRQRRAERQQAKWERARKEREAIEQTFQDEQALLTKAAAGVQLDKYEANGCAIAAPVGPLELLALPNAPADLDKSNYFISSATSAQEILISSKVEEVCLSSTPSTTSLDGNTNSNIFPLPDNPDQKFDLLMRPIPNEDRAHADEADSLNHANGHAETNSDAKINGSANCEAQEGKVVKRRKSVRFSPTVEQTTFVQSEPPSSEMANSAVQADELPPVIEDQEHLQLTMEEAFFLSYGLGVLTIYDADTKKPIPTKELFSRFRQTSYFPPAPIPLARPDDPFMINYVVYHHFRSLGWVVRGGIKFSVDFLLYSRGPVFTHAEFGVIILPSYSDPYWSADEATCKYVAKKEPRSWSWLHCINRVNSQVKKTLILVYVDIPTPLPSEEEKSMPIAKILERYTVREVVLKRWLSNRSRD